MRKVYPLPKSVAQHIGLCQNFGLFFDRYLGYPLNHNNDCLWKWKVSTKTKGGERERDQKPDAWRDIEHRVRTSLTKMQDLHQAAMARRDRYFRSTKNTTPVKAKLKTRLAIGLGSPNVLENGITLHRVYGFPTIPGSAVKGVCASWRFQQIAEELRLPALEAHELNRRKHEDHHYISPWEKLRNLLNQEIDWNPPKKDAQANLESYYKNLVEGVEQLLRGRDEQDLRGPKEMTQLLANHHREYQTLFGSPSREGSVIFGDAYPTQLMLPGRRPIIELDLVNPHYSRYYRGGVAPPSDDDAPNPSNFLTVAAGTEFQFFVQANDVKTRDKAVSILATALTQCGIGAKTSANYGWFHPPA